MARNRTDNKENGATQKSRGVIYIYWGTKHAAELERSVESVRKQGLPVHLIKLEDPASGLGEKTRMMELTPFETTLFLDTDTLVFDNIDYGFEMAEKHGMAMAIDTGCYASRWVGIPDDVVEYNSGAIFFSKTSQVKKVFERWRTYADDYDRDQAGLARAIHELSFNPFVLQRNFNFRGDWGDNPVFGPLKIWHARVKAPLNIKSWNNRRYHASGILIRLPFNNAVIVPFRYRSAWHMLKEAVKWPIRLLLRPFRPSPDSDKAKGFDYKSS